MMREEYNARARQAGMHVKDSSRAGNSRQWACHGDVALYCGMMAKASRLVTCKCLVTLKSVGRVEVLSGGEEFAFVGALCRGKPRLPVYNVVVTDNVSRPRGPAVVLASRPCHVFEDRAEMK